MTVPETVAGYSVLLLDPYGNIYTSEVPSKDAGVTTRTTVYALVAPGYNGPVPARAKRVELPLPFMMLIFRADRFSNGVDQTAEATAFRANLLMQPLRDWIKDRKGGATAVRSVADFAFPVKTLADTLIRTDPISFLRQMQTAVADQGQTPPLTPQERKLSDDFNALFGDGSDLGPAERSMFAAGARAAHDALISNYLGNRDANQWIHFTNIGAWGKKVLDRASITEFIQFGNGISTAAYYHTFLDGNRAPLEGSTAGGYVLRFPPGGTPEASRFWSLTAYTPDAIEMIPNPIDKYLVASYTPGLVKSPDGSISIYIAKTKPAGVPEANWLPVSDRAFNLMLRVYGVVPKSDVAKNKYVPPPVMKR